MTDGVNEAVAAVSEIRDAPLGARPVRVYSVGRFDVVVASIDAVELAGQILSIHLRFGRKLDMHFPNVEEAQCARAKLLDLVVAASRAS